MYKVKKHSNLFEKKRRYRAMPLLNKQSQKYNKDIS